MVKNVFYQEWTELPAVFKRNAASYLFSPDKVGPYRPVTMFTLIATHLVAPRPWLHHAVGWLLHVATSVLLFLALRRSEHSVPDGDRTGGTSELVAAGLAVLFFLHPVHVESYVWINGRSDLLAGFWLAIALNLLGLLGDDARRPRRWVLALGIVAFLGASSKLPFAVAVGAAWLAWGVQTRSRWWRAAGGAIAVGVGSHVILRAIYAPFRGQVGAAENVLSDPSIWWALPRLAAKGTTAFLAFPAEAMQSLTWVLSGPWTVSDWLGLALAVSILSFLTYRRDWPGVVYWIGAILTLAPVVLVSAAFWLGFDRYLYMPMILASLSLRPYVVRAAARGPAQRRALCILAFGLIVFSVAQTHKASANYANQQTFEEALMRDHADDPTIHYYLATVAARRSKHKRMREHLSAMPPPPWPAPIIVRTYELALRARNTNKAREAVDALVATSSNHRNCTDVRAQLEVWLVDQSNTEISRHIEEQLARLTCSP